MSFHHNHVHHVYIVHTKITVYESVESSSKPTYIELKNHQVSIMKKQKYVFGTDM